MDLNKINNSEFEEPLRRITSPMTPWQVYELGLTINNAAAKIYDLLAVNCTDREWINLIGKNNQIEAEALKDRISLHRTNEMVDYYGSRGRIKHGIEGVMDRQMYDIFDDDVKTFLVRFDRILETIKQKKAPFNREEAGELCAEITNEIGKFYQAIIDLYPPGETCAAVQDVLHLSLTAYQAGLQ